MSCLDETACIKNFRIWNHSKSLVGYYTILEKSQESAINKSLESKKYFFCIFEYLIFQTIRDLIFIFDLKITLVSAINYNLCFNKNMFLDLDFDVDFSVNFPVMKVKRCDWLEFRL